MEVDSYSKYLTQMVSEPEKAAEIAVTVLDQIRADAATFEAQKADLEGLTKENSDLKQSNIKMFLQITGQRQEEEEEEDLTLEEFAKQM